MDFQRLPSLVAAAGNGVGEQCAPWFVRQGPLEMSGGFFFSFFFFSRTFSCFFSRSSLSVRGSGLEVLLCMSTSSSCCCPSLKGWNGHQLKLLPAQVEQSANWGVASQVVFCVLGRTSCLLPTPLVLPWFRLPTAQEDLLPTSHQKLLKIKWIQKAQCNLLGQESKSFKLLVYHISKRSFNQLLIYSI